MKEIGLIIRISE